MESESPVYEDLKSTLIAWPTAVALTLVVKWIGFFHMIFWYFFTIPTHEFGHAWAAWLGGRIAIPIGAFIPMAAVTYTFYDRSILVYLALLGFFLWLIYEAFRAKTPFLLILGVLGIFVQHRMTWVLPMEKWKMLFTYGGIGGEFILGTLLSIACFYRMPKKFHWDFFRYLSLTAGTYAFFSAFIQWREIRFDLSKMPLGTFSGGSDDSGGDLDQLMNVYGWSYQQIISHYNQLGMICLSVIAAHYVYCGVRAWKKSRT